MPKMTKFFYRVRVNNKDQQIDCNEHSFIDCNEIKIEGAFLRIIGGEAYLEQIIPANRIIEVSKREEE